MWYSSKINKILVSLIEKKINCYEKVNKALIIKNIRDDLWKLIK